MKEKKCGTCSKTTTSLKGWFYCKSCGTHFCPDCAVDHVAQEKEEKQMQKARRLKTEKGGLGNRCPQCNSSLTQFYSPDL